jgi:four helix bundle protein
MKDSIIAHKSRLFAIRIIRLYQYFLSDKKEFILSKQLLRSGTSIGANVKEAAQAQSKKDFIAKMQISLKEASETEYWIDLLHETDYIDDKQFISITDDCIEIIKLLTAIIKQSKE